MSVGRRYWESRLRSWRGVENHEHGYTLALPVPADLPVFLDIALSICARLDGERRREILVIPDCYSRGMARYVAERAGEYAEPVRMAWLPLAESYLLRARPNPFLNYGLQFLTAAQHATSSHVIMHDADLFVADPAMLESLFDECVERRLGCLGVNAVWDEWFAERGVDLVATWELTFATSWARSFPPYQHMPRDWEVGGQWHAFDVSLYPQYRTDPQRIGRTAGSFDFSHFNHVIGTFRKFQRAKGSFLDDSFRLLLIRLLCDVRSVASSGVPPMAELTRGLTDAAQRVTYANPDDPETAEGYRLFREKLSTVLAHPIFDAATPDRAFTALAPFDKHYGV